MLDKIILCFVFKLIFAQVSGEFWWSSNKLRQLKGVEVPTHTFENISEIDTDELDKIVLRDNDLISNRKPAIIPESLNENNLTKSEKLSTEIQFKNETKIVWPTDSQSFTSDSTYTHSFMDNPNGVTTYIDDDKKDSDQRSQDDFKIIFPSEYDVLTTKTNKLNVLAPIKRKQNTKNTKSLVKNKIEYFTTTNEALNSENICTYVKKAECYRRNGIMYGQIEKTAATICCILPLPQEQISKILFPDSYSNKNKRYRRSADDFMNPALKQRNILLKRKYDAISSTQRESRPKVVSLVSSEEDYIDPYWNIKNSNIKSPNSHHKPTKSNNDCNQDYVGDYISEVPKPGLLGVYSDHSGSSYGGYIEDYDYNDESPGYSTLDPRRSTIAPPQRKKSSKPLAESDEVSYKPESQTISYQSSPDFQVLQGFKLLNLARKKNKFYSKNTKKTMAESIVEKNSEESIHIKSSAENNNFVDKQVYKTCGTTTVGPISDGVQIGSTENGSHPWLAIVVETKKRKVILCYATIVHPRAAMTSADCVHGASKGEITLIAGLWDLKDRSQSQSRLASIVLHPQYKPNDLAHNLAVLYWSQPLRLGVNVQPACFGEPRADEDCKLFGWSGFDQAIRLRSRWQAATILTPRECNERLSTNKRGPRVPADSFCASVQARGTVSGIGGPLICDKDGRSTATGVAVWRDTILVFMPATDWPRRAVLELLGN